MENSITYKSILYTFRYGKLPNYKLIVLFICICFSLLLCCCGIYIWSLLTNENRNNLRIGMVIIGLQLLIVVVVLIVLALRFFLIRKNIRKWLTDSDIIERNVIPFKFSETGDAFAGAIKIGARFRINNHKILQISKKYSVAFNQIVGREICILYSPKYNEVMVLSDNIDNDSR